MFHIYLKIEGSLFGAKPHRAKKVRKRKERILFIAYAKQFVTSSTKRVSQSTVKNYNTALTSFSTFLKGKDIAAEAVKNNVINDFCLWLKEHNVSENTSSCYMRSLRAIYNSAVKQKMTSQKQPFSDVFTGNKKTEKRSMDKKDINKIISMPPEKDKRLLLTHDIFAFCLFAMGMPFIDAYCLTKDKIHDGIITYKRHKTGQAVNVTIEKCMKAIINNYSRSESEFIFPLGQDEESFNYKAYHSALSQYNKYLKTIARKAGVTANISSYSARHTWASFAFKENVPLLVISQALGHTSTNTTLTYISEIEASKLASINKKIIKDFGGSPIRKRYEFIYNSLCYRYLSSSINLKIA